MPGGKKPLPLFELVGERDGAPRREPLPVLIPPAPAPVRGTGPDFQPREPKPLLVESRPDRDIHESPARVLPGMGGRPIVIGSTALWLCAAAGLLLVFVVWVTGNAFGRRQAEQQFERNFGQAATQPAGGPNATAGPTSDSGRVQDPLSRPVQAQPVAEKPSPGTGQAGTLPAGQVLTAKGAAPDPRQSGWNYLLLGVVSQEEAMLVLPFFAKNGVETLAVALEPVDRKSGRGNTSPRFQLFAAKGIASSEFASKQVERDRLKQEIVRLGALWKKDHKGSMSFSDAFWLKND